jgi:hypothetical protein
MMPTRRRWLWWLLIFICSGSVPAWAQSPECPRLAAKVDLGAKEFRQPTGEQQGKVDAGQGLTLVMEPLKPPDPETGDQNRLTVWDRGVKVKEIRTSGWFMGFSRQETASVTYWLLEDFSGGAHCCFRQHLFCLPARQASVKFLGAINLGNAGEETYQEQFHCQDGKIILQSEDDRFAYFMTSFATSGVMFFPRFHQISPEGIKLVNEQFKQAYLEEIKKIEGYIKEELPKRSPPRPTIIYGTGSESLLSDNLAILLTARTINYLCAREEVRAWQTLDQDVGRYYQSKQGLKHLRQEIQKMMARQPY